MTVSRDVLSSVDVIIEKPRRKTMTHERLFRIVKLPLRCMSSGGWNGHKKKRSHRQRIDGKFNFISPYGQLHCFACLALAGELPTRRKTMSSSISPLMKSVRVRRRWSSDGLLRKGNSPEWRSFCFGGKNRHDNNAVPLVGRSNIPISKPHTAFSTITSLDRRYCHNIARVSSSYPYHFHPRANHRRHPFVHNNHFAVQYHNQQQLKNQRQVRNMSIVSYLPEAVQQFSIWGGTGAVISTLHSSGGMPYWACFATMNFMLRASLVPLVIYSAKMAARYAKVAPEIQFIVTLFQNDLKKMRAEGKSLTEQRHLFLQNMQTVQGIYKLHDINPLTVFLSPLLQIPFFYYVAVDLRKIVNGADPELAQELTESSFLWVHDLTDPDPWYGLPIAAGVMLYTNVEVAIGRQSLSGPTASKSDFARLLKDLFQTLAVFMPCFASQSPAGLQIYLVSSFTWTLFQSAALRNDTMRMWLGLPAMGTPPTEPKFAKEFMEFKKLEQKAKEIRGDGPVLGRNVLAVGFETSFPGTNRPSTIKGSDIPPHDMEDAVGTTDESGYGSVPRTPKITMSQASAAWGGQFIHGISAPMDELEQRIMDQMMSEQAKEVAAQKLESERGQFMSQPSEDDMKAANLGVVIPKTTNESNGDSPVGRLGSKALNADRFRRIKEKTTKHKRGPRKKR